MTLEVTPADATLGAFVTGVRLAALSDAEWRAIEAAFLERGVLVFPAQHLSHAEQTAFGLRFGALDPLVAKSGTVAISNLRPDGSIRLNAHTHLHCCVTDGVFSVDADDTLRFHPAVDLDAAAISAVQRRIRTRVLRIAARHGALTPDVAADLARWGHGGGFSLHAAVRIEAGDRPGLERLLRYCARPAFASERLSWDGSDQPVRYSLSKPLPTGRPSSPSPRSSCSTGSPR